MIEYYLLELIENINTTGLYNINDTINYIIRENTTYLSLLPIEIINIIISNIPMTINIGNIIKDDKSNYFKVIDKLININGRYALKYKYMDFPWYIIDTNSIISKYYVVQHIDNYVYPICFNHNIGKYSYAIDIYNVDKGLCNIV